MSQLQKYQGGCHCGNVRFEVQADLTGTVAACNCSICSKMGWLLAFVPTEQFTLLSGEESLSDYQFAKKNVHHLFCKVCGIRSFTRGQGRNGPVCSINVRCLDGVDADALTIKRFDGRSL